MKRAAIYSPSWASLGGGERYASAFAKMILNLGYQVDIWWNTDISPQIKDRFDIDLSDCTFKNYLPDRTSFIQRLSTSSKYDLIFWVSDGSIPISLAKKTLIHFQIPFHRLVTNSLPNKIKANLYSCICNSKFTKEFIDKTYSISSQVIYPPVDVDSFPSIKKTNSIVSLARFSTLLHAKRQDTLIKAFFKIHNSLPDWELILAGGSLDPEYIVSLKKQAKGLPIRIITNPSLSQIKSLLGQAKIFWSATGFEVNDKINPEKVEHFGITTVEAMAAGAVPIVTNSGGHKETVVDKHSGFLWNTLDQLKEMTLTLAGDDTKLKQISVQARDRSKLFSTEIFNTNYKKIL